VYVWHLCENCAFAMQSSWQEFRFAGKLHVRRMSYHVHLLGVSIARHPLDSCLGPRSQPSAQHRTGQKLESGHFLSRKLPQCVRAHVLAGHPQGFASTVTVQFKFTGHGTCGYAGLTMTRPLTAPPRQCAPPRQLFAARAWLLSGDRDA
jgi:hypothetical protein